MQVIEGSVTLLGNATIANKVTTYSVIEIGGQIVQKVRVPTSLDNFLTRALNQDGTSKLFLRGKLLVGVQTPEKKIYCYKANAFAGLFLCIVGVPLIPFLGIGLIFIWQGVAELKNVAAVSELKAMGATPISL
jgi:hypothetical protein